MGGMGGMCVWLVGGVEGGLCEEVRWRTRDGRTGPACRTSPPNAQITQPSRSTPLKITHSDHPDNTHTPDHTTPESNHLHEVLLRDLVAAAHDLLQQPRQCGRRVALEGEAVELREVGQVLADEVLFCIDCYVFCFAS